jgi:hypothetical protein
LCVYVYRVVFSKRAGQMRDADQELGRSMRRRMGNADQRALF